MDSAGSPPLRHDYNFRGILPGFSKFGDRGTTTTSGGCSRGGTGGQLFPVLRDGEPVGRCAGTLPNWLCSGRKCSGERELADYCSETFNPLGLQLDWGALGAPGGLGDRRIGGGCATITAVNSEAPQHSGDDQPTLGCGGRSSMTSLSSSCGKFQKNCPTA